MNVFHLLQVVLILTIVKNVHLTKTQHTLTVYLAKV